MDEMVQAMHRRKFQADQVQVFWMIQGDPQYAFVPTGTNDEIEITLVPRDEKTVAIGPIHVTKHLLRPVAFRLAVQMRLVLFFKKALIGSNETPSFKHPIPCLFAPLSQ